MAVPATLTAIILCLREKRLLAHCYPPKTTVMREHVKQTVIRQSSAGYFVGFIGAAVYFIQHAVGFWPGVLGFLKACVWPAFVVYHLLGFLKA